MFIQNKNIQLDSPDLPSIKNTAAKVFFWLSASFCSIALGYAMVTRTETAFLTLAIFAVIYLIWRKPEWSIHAIILLTVVGEFARLPILGENGFLINDPVIGIFVAIWLIKKILNQEKLQPNPLTSPLLFFALIGVISLVQSLFFLQPTEVIKSSLYLIRFIEYGLLAISLPELLTPKQIKRLLPSMIFSVVLIAIAGFVQLVVYPDLIKLVEYGWDPHINRLVSTWLDPNFIGGILSFIMMIILGVAVYTKDIFKKIGFVILIVILGTALFLTYSRSGYVAFAAGALIIGTLKSRKLLIAGIIIVALALPFSPRAQQRVTDLVHSAISVLSNNAENPDATARLRIESWEQTIKIIQKRPWFGSGYNTLRYVKYNEGFVENTTVHSASGSDSSLLTILATTGIIGLIPFLLLCWKLAALSFQNWRNKNLSHLDRGFAIGFLAGLGSLFIHAFFVNSLLFTPILLFIWVGSTYLLSSRAPLKN